ncbi:MAG: N-alpha-acetyl diaminobutyric acid deacetylase DoeB [Alphaproteobacteria bacterium]|nr:N-alpha-acetyl diaminobutyric acid deacetylase DoeB [Alphaproteobacteria bacterium]
MAPRQESHDLDAFGRLTGIDPFRPGKRHGRIAIPLRGKAPIALPVTVVRRGPGPLVLFTGGNHGDEFEGPIALMKIARALEPRDLVQGGAIFMPAINPPAIAAGTRTSPLDGRNLNRSFPGCANGTPTERIAHAITTAVLPHAVALFDLHAGGRTSVMIPSVMAHVFRDAQCTRRTVDAMKAFRAPAGILIKEYETRGMIDTTAERMGLIFGCCELGGAGMVTPETVGIAETGVRNVLKHFGIMAGRPVTAPWLGRRRSRVLEALSYDCYAKASVGGIFEPFVDLEARVAKGQPIGQIHPLGTARPAPAIQHAPVAGRVFMRHAFGLIARREWVAIVARDSDR